MFNSKYKYISDLCSKPYAVRNAVFVVDYTLRLFSKRKMLGMKIFKIPWLYYHQLVEDFFILSVLDLLLTKNYSENQDIMIKTTWFQSETFTKSYCNHK